jgi:hypothetical protein
MRQIVDRLSNLVAGIIVPTEKLEIARQAIVNAKSSVALIAALPTGALSDARRRTCCERGIREVWLAGVVVEATTERLEQADLAAIRQLREAWGPEPVIIAARGRRSRAGRRRADQRGARTAEADQRGAALS